MNTRNVVLESRFVTVRRDALELSVDNVVERMSRGKSILSTVNSAVSQIMLELWIMQRNDPRLNKLQMELRANEKCISTGSSGQM